MVTAIDNSVASGPEGTSFDGGVFVTELIFPTDYPLSPPKMKFLSDMFHPNGQSFTCSSQPSVNMFIPYQFIQMEEYVSPFSIPQVRTL